MHSSNWLEYYLILEVLASAFTWKFFTAAGRPAWEAFVPVLRTYRLLQITGRPLIREENPVAWKVVGLRAFWTFLFFVPVVGNVMTIILVYELLHVFNYRKLSSTFLTIITLGAYLGYLNYTAKLQYVGRDQKNIKKALGEGVSSIIFAVVAATFIRALTFEAYTIPTSSMEKSLMVGDFLFVSKMHYGSRVPMTPVSVPLLHNTLPFSTLPSYTDIIQFPYIRLPKFQEVERGESVVFNYPMDSEMPIDKRTNYIKRCVGIPGDSLRIVDQEIYLQGGRKFELPERAKPQTSYLVETNGTDFSPRFLHKNFGLTYDQYGTIDPNGGDVIRQLVRTQQGLYPTNNYQVQMSPEYYEEFGKLGNVKRIIPVLDKFGQSKELDQQLMGQAQNIFPNPFHSDSLPFRFTRDNYGPIYIPRAGDKVELNAVNYLFYRRIIDFYEGHSSEWKDGQAWVDGQPASHYTFAMNYYWMMGDNRHNSLDSRFWGYVPEDHIVGKPVFIWMSYDKFGEGMNKIRWDRVFTTVHGDGPRKSYFFHVLIAGLLIYFLNNFLKKRKAKKAHA